MLQFLVLHCLWKSTSKVATVYHTDDMTPLPITPSRNLKIRHNTYCALPADPGEAGKTVNKYRKSVLGWMKANKLKLHPNKTKVLGVGKV